VKIYTKTGDDGTTGLLYGGRVAKNDLRPTAYGDVDEAQAAIGLARAAADQEVGEILLVIESELWIVMAELACSPDQMSKLTEAGNRISSSQVKNLEDLIDQIAEKYEQPTEFVLPGGSEVSARLDLARAITRRAERVVLPVVEEDSQILPYLNRLADLLWVMARWQEETSITSRSINSPK
jgi:cob(I)alamin adenosyltransferase